ncbi:Gcd10p family-domain-containing protein [Kalaharituber pfeilii]|nr:Gcd10p family-domain-containing protein [Kalaharituber pfeilii]
MPPALILPNTYALLRLPNQTSKLVKIIPDSSVISLGKFGAFPTDSLIYRPYHLTFDVLDEPGTSGLAVVSTEEITRDLLGEQLLTAREEEEGESEDAEEESGRAFSTKDADLVVLDDAGLDDERNNRETIDDPSAQKLSWKEIEELKREGGGSGKDIIAALMTSHTNIHQKTAYSLSKYALRKRSKYLKRFTVVPVDVSNLLDYLMAEKEPPKIMELQQEGLGLMLSLGNLRYCPDIKVGDEVRRGGRWLVVDETGGLLVAAVAERLGLLEYEPKYLKDRPDAANDSEESDDEDAGPSATAAPTEDGPPTKKAKLSHSHPPQQQHPPRPPAPPLPAPATANTITVVHPNEQPNLSLLKYFQYDTNTPPADHPLHTHLRTISYLSLLSPASDPALVPPERVPESVFRAWKSGKKSAYLRKWRRWERSARTVMETRAGGFDGLLVASWMDVEGLLAHLVPFVRGSGQVVVWRPERESLVRVVDACGKERKGEWLKKKENRIADGASSSTGLYCATAPGYPEPPSWETEILPKLPPMSNANVSYYLSPDASSSTSSSPEDITALLTPSSLPDLMPPPESGPRELDPTLLLAPTIHQTRVRRYQVLPGRTHPVMTSRGGAEGYVFVATRVVPVEGRVEAMGRGAGRKRNKAGAATGRGAEGGGGDE